MSLAPTTAAPTTMNDLRPGTAVKVGRRAAIVIGPAASASGRSARFVQFEDGTFARVVRAARTQFTLMVVDDDAALRRKTRLLALAYQTPLTVGQHDDVLIHASWLVSRTVTTVHLRDCNCAKADGEFRRDLGRQEAATMAAVTDTVWASCAAAAAGVEPTIVRDGTPLKALVGARVFVKQSSGTIEIAGGTSYTGIASVYVKFDSPRKRSAWVKVSGICLAEPAALSA